MMCKPSLVVFCPINKNTSKLKRFYVVGSRKSDETKNYRGRGRGKNIMFSNNRNVFPIKILQWPAKLTK